MKDSPKDLNNMYLYIDSKTAPLTDTYWKLDHLVLNKNSQIRLFLFIKLSSLLVIYFQQYIFAQIITSSNGQSNKTPSSKPSSAKSIS